MIINVCRSLKVSRIKFKSLVYLLLTFFNTSQFYSQSIQKNLTLKLTLNKAREIGVENDVNVQTKAIDILVAKENIKQSKQELFPEVYMDFNLQKNLIIPSTPVPANAFNPNAKDGDLLLLRFSTNWIGNGGLNLKYDIFNPDQKSRLRQSEIKVKLAVTEKEISKVDAILAISTAYIEALIAKEQLKLTEADVLAKTKTYSISVMRYEEGRNTRVELNNSKSTMNIARTKNKEAKSIVDKVNAELLYVLGYNPTSNFNIEFEDDIETLYMNYNFSYQKSNFSFDMQKLEQEKNLLKEEKLAAKLKYYPRVSIGAFYGSNYFDNQFDLFKDHNWHGNSYVKLGVVVPLSDWLHYKNEKAIINHQINVKDLAYNNLDNKSALNYFKALKDIQFTKLQYEDLKSNFLLEEKNFLLFQEQYAAGRLLIDGLSTADYAVQFAKNEYLNAAYNYLLAELRMEHELSR